MHTHNEKMLSFKHHPKKKCHKVVDDNDKVFQDGQFLDKQELVGNEWDSHTQRWSILSPTSKSLCESIVGNQVFGIYANNLTCLRSLLSAYR